MKYIMI